MLGWREAEGAGGLPRALLCHGSVALPDLMDTYSDASVSLPLSLYSAQTPFSACGELQEATDEGDEGKGRLGAVGRVLQRLTQKRGAGDGSAVHEADDVKSSDWWTVALTSDVVKSLEAAVAVGDGEGSSGQSVTSAVVYEARGCWWQTQVSAEAAGVLGDGADEGLGIGLGQAVGGKRRVRVRLPWQRPLLACVDLQLLLTRTQVDCTAHELGLAAYRSPATAHSCGISLSFVSGRSSGSWP